MGKESSDAEFGSRYNRAEGWRRATDPGHAVEIGPSNASLIAGALRFSGTTQIQFSTRINPLHETVSASCGTSATPAK